MRFRFSLYSARGTCCLALDRSGKAASLAPKNMVTNTGGGATDICTGTEVGPGEKDVDVFDVAVTSGDERQQRRQESSIYDWLFVIGSTARI